VLQLAKRILVADDAPYGLKESLANSFNVCVFHASTLQRLGLAGPEIIAAVSEFVSTAFAEGKTLAVNGVHALLEIVRGLWRRRKTRVGAGRVA
jgi:hypothetical protein